MRWFTRTSGKDQMAQTAGYSGKPLWQKLGMKPGFRCLAITPPDHYAALIDGAEGIQHCQTGPADIVHLFCRTADDLADEYQPALDQVAEGGMLWVSWPKKSSPRFIDLTEDGIRAAVLPTGWVDVKVCAVDTDWSGLKFLRRRK